METANAARRVDVDWLRVVATFLLFPYHAAMVFSPAPFYHVRNADLSVGLMVFGRFVSLWHMPLFFGLAGWSIVASLQARGDAGFLRERVRRLAVPLVVGCALLMPPIKYLELSSGLDLNHRGLFATAQWLDGFRGVAPGGVTEMAPFTESFRAFLPTFYTRLDRFTWAHLWFLAYLLTLSIVYRPLITRLVARRGDLGRYARVWVYAPIVPLVLVQVLLRPHWPGVQNLYDDWANVAYYSIFLLAGAMLARHRDLEHAVAAERWRLLAVATIAASVRLLAGLGAAPGSAVSLAAWGVASWCWVLALLAFARRVPLPDGPVLAYLAEAALPVYVLHQLAVVGMGYGIVGLPLGIAAKFTLVIGSALAATLAVYEVVVRPSPVLRWAFGMRARACPARTPAVDTPCSPRLSAASVRR